MCIFANIAFSWNLGACLWYCSIYAFSDSKVFFADGPTRIGGVYKKIIFREYTDASFDEPKPHPDELGLLGPIISGEIGDTIKIVFKNTARNRVSFIFRW